MSSKISHIVYFLRFGKKIQNNMRYFICVLPQISHNPKESAFLRSRRKGGAPTAVSFKWLKSSVFEPILPHILSRCDARHLFKLPDKMVLIRISR